MNMDDFEEVMHGDMNHTNYTNCTNIRVIRGICNIRDMQKRGSAYIALPQGVSVK